VARSNSYFPKKGIIFLYTTAALMEFDDFQLRVSANHKLASA
jgi:hypothetical protein